MKKKYLVELIIAILLVISEIVLIIVKYPEAMRADYIDVYMTALFSVYINIFAIYGVILIILNGNWRK
jgi:hypothetical protein